MKISLDWLNTYLNPHVGADDVDRVLTDQGLPIESRVPVPGSPSDVVLDVEVTSNRSDCLSHLGLAREVAAGTDATLIRPELTDDPPDQTPATDGVADVTVADAALCPKYTARVIRGVTVGPSPAWLVNRLESIGMRSVNNVVDVTNFVLMELGQPLHAFDLATLKGGRIVVRTANQDEPFEAINGGKYKLNQDMLVIADGERAVALAGVMGGVDTEVTSRTTDVLLESAVFDPLSTRRTSRALKLASESSYRFERGVDPEQIEAASHRAAGLICELAGGTIAQGVTVVGDPAIRQKKIEIRVHRCNTLLGLEIPAEQIIGYLERLGFAPKPSPNGTGVIACTPPSHRHDVTREVDLIEEVARLHGFGPVRVDEKIHIKTQPVQPDVSARREIRRAMTAHGFCETINPTLVVEEQGRDFLPTGAQSVVIDDQHRRPDGMLRPSLLPSLLACRKLNQDVGNDRLRLYEMGSTWSSRDKKIEGQHTLAMLVDADDQQQALRTLRAVIDDVVKQLTGVCACGVTPADLPGYEPGATVVGDGVTFGRLGIVRPRSAKDFDLQTPVAAAELDVDTLIAAYPPTRTVRRLPRYPSIQRDLSLIVGDDVTWDSIQKTIDSARLDFMEHAGFLGTYRGKPIPRGKKSVSLRLEFRSPDATLRHDEVDPQVSQLVERLGEQLSAQLRG